MLLEAGIDSNYKNIEGETALFQAVRRNNYNITNLLLKYQADINIKNPLGETVMQLAAQTNNDKLEQLLMQYKSVQKLGSLKNIPKVK